MTHALALIFTIAVVTAMIAEGQNRPYKVAMNSPAIQIELALAPEPPAPRVPDPPTPQPPKPLPVHKKMPVQPQPAPVSLPLMAEVAETPAVNDLPDSPQESQAPPIPAKASAGTLEAQYAATLRTNIDARTVVPSSVEYRLRKPKGETRVDFTLDRAGSVLTTRIARTSGSDILDRQAVGIVKAGRYPPFPLTAFAGELRHSFIVTLEFNL